MLPEADKTVTSVELDVSIVISTRVTNYYYTKCEKELEYKAVMHNMF